MKDRSPRPLSEKEVRLLVMSPLARVYVKLGTVAQNPFVEESVKVSTLHQRARLFNRMSDSDREGLYSYEKWQSDEASRMRGTALTDQLDHI